ncbi:MAG TPA: TonB-dependent receptor [Longimicrobiales bacterium]|nr:TonB-dependent receptor [Longimicrobiales bacterium]
MAWAAVALLAGAGDVAAQAGGDVYGQVLDRAGGVVPFGEVTLLPGGRGTLADGAGRFSIRDVRPGRYRVHASSIGYAPAAVVAAVAAGGATEVRIALGRTALAVPGLEVTASPGAADARAVAQATTQLSGRALERHLGGTVAQTLEGQPGVAVRYNGPAAAAPVIRGLSGERIVVLEDGQRAADLSGSAIDHGVTIDPLSASRIEVVRGPASLLYGNNALGGVVNVITGELPLDVPSSGRWVAGAQTETALRGGSVSVHGALPLAGRWAVSAGGSARRTGNVRIPAAAELGGALANTAFRSQEASLGVGYGGSAASAAVEMKGYGFHYGLPARPGTDPLYWEGRRLEVRGRAEASLGSAAFSSLRLDGTAQDYAHDELSRASGTGNHFALRTATAGALLQQERLGPFRRGAIGASVLGRRYTSRGASALTPPAASRSAGAFAFEEAGLGGEAALQFGARVDRYRVATDADERFGPAAERTFTSFSGSVGAVVPLTPALSGALTLARAFRAPTVEELFSHALHAGTGEVELGAPTLEPERSLGVDAVLRLHAGGAEGQLAAYQNDVAGYIYPSTVGDTLVGGQRLPVVRYVQEGAVLRGLEGSLEVAPVASVVLGFSGDVVAGHRRSGEPLPFLPPARLGASLRWDDGTRSVGAEARHAFARRRASAGDETPTNGYTLLNLEAALRWRAGPALHAVSLRLDNATNALYRDAASRIKDFAPNPGRSLALLYRLYR